jgi:hypothetical protein
MAAMEGGIEAGDLEQPRHLCLDRFDRSEVVRLMERGEGAEGFESLASTEASTATGAANSTPPCTTR